MTQEHRSVDEYFKEMEVIMIKVGMSEENEVTMVSFFNGLHHDIRNVVEL